MAPRRKRPERSISIEKWSWRDAEQALMKNNINRHVRETDVDKYARAMSSKDIEGRPLWGICTDPIVFDWDGNMIDGQHRCLAQVRSKTNREWTVYRGVPPETQRHINTGIPRAPYDQLRFEGYSNGVVLASVARWAFMLEQGQIGSGKFKVSTDEILDMVHRHEDLVHSAQQGQYSRTGFVAMSPSPVGTAHWWISQHNEQSEADIFIDRIVHMNREPDGSAILALIKRFTEARRQKINVPTRNQIAVLVKAWNYDVKGQYVQKMNVFPRGEFKMPKVLKREVSQTKGIIVHEDREEELEEEDK